MIEMIQPLLQLSLFAANRFRCWRISFTADRFQLMKKNPRSCFRKKDVLLFPQIVWCAGVRWVIILGKCLDLYDVRGGKKP